MLATKRQIRRNERHKFVCPLAVHPRYFYELLELLCSFPSTATVLRISSVLHHISNCLHPLG